MSDMFPEVPKLDEEIKTVYDENSIDIADVDAQQMLKPEYFMHLNMIAMHQVMKFAATQNNMKNGIVALHYFILDTEAIARSAKMLSLNYERELKAFQESPDFLSLSLEDKNNRLMLKKKELLMTELFSRRMWKFPVKM